MLNGGGRWGASRAQLDAAARVHTQADCAAAPRSTTGPPHTFRQGSSVCLASPRPNGPASEFVAKNDPNDCAKEPVKEEGYHDDREGHGRVPKLPMPRRLLRRVVLRCESFNETEGRACEEREEGQHHAPGSNADEKEDKADGEPHERAKSKYDRRDPDCESVVSAA